MIKQILTKPLFGRRPRKINAMFCDGCGRQITCSSSGEFGKDLCEKCFKSQKERSNVSKTDGHKR
ncbi:MAG: hypothetical protein NC332_05490 [Firmicutes bacterium]|nr:hypothetical protein [Bacillota bacterium]